MEITASDAVEHIANSLDNDYGSWYDKDNQATWHIDKFGPESLSITIISDEGTEEVYAFTLVKHYN
jgi:hypothetical protein